jgi:non-ribosomal peptide synthetase component F
MRHAQPVWRPQEICRDNSLHSRRSAALEKLLAREARSIQSQTRIPARPAGCEAPLSAAERRLRFLAHLEPGNPAYNVYHAVQIDGLLDEEILRETYRRLIDRHEILRTTYPFANGAMRRSIAAESSVDLKVVDLGQQPEDQRDRQLHQLLYEEARTGFDLQTAPLFRLLLVRLAPNRRVLLTTAHHIIADGRSLAILAHESMTISAGRAANSPEPLPGLAVQYADFAWFEEQQAAWREHLPYWKNQLAGAPPLLELPVLHRRPAIRSSQGQRYPIRIDPERLTLLKTLGRQHGATLFATVLAVFGVLLHRYSGATDIVVGTPVANRNSPDLENLVGCFINALALRLDLSEDVPFLDLLTRVRRMVQEALQHQDLPFDKLVDELKPPRTRSYTPVFQVMFNLQREWTEKARRLEIRPVPVHNGTSMVDLTLSLTESDIALDGYLEYSSDLFDEPAIARMAEHFDTLLTSVLAHPARPLSALPLLTAAERQRIFEGWNGTSREWPPELVPAMFEAQAARTPGNVAVVHEGRELTYRELDRRANQIAHLLRSFQIGPGSLVGVLLEKSLDTLPALLGVMKAGAAYVPLDPQYPATRLRVILEDARPDLLLCNSDVDADLAPYGETRTLHLRADRARIDAQPVDSPDSMVGPADPAYVIYTSGTTGVPKGVIIPHRALANHMRWFQDEFSLTPADRVVQRTSLSFDLSVWELFAPLLAGARLILPSTIDVRDPQRLAELVRRRQATVIQFVPSLLREALAGGSFGHL